MLKQIKYIFWRVRVQLLIDNIEKSNTLEFGVPPNFKWHESISNFPINLNEFCIFAVISNHTDNALRSSYKHRMWGAEPLEDFFNIVLVNDRQFKHSNLENFQIFRCQHKASLSRQNLWKSVTNQTSSNRDIADLRKLDFSNKSKEKKSKKNIRQHFISFWFSL